MHLRRAFSIKTTSDEFLEELKSTATHNKQIKTCHSYEMTTNLKYAALF